MSRTLIVAAREYRQLLSSRAFWVTLMALPVLIAVTGTIVVLSAPPPGGAFWIVDRDGRYKAAIEHRLALQQARTTLCQFGFYARRWSQNPEPRWAERGGCWYDDAEAERFLAAGGAAAAFAALRPQLRPDAPSFQMPQPRFYAVAAPPAVADTASPDSFAGIAAPYLSRLVPTADGIRRLSLAVLVPRRYGEPGIAARLATDGRAEPELIGLVAAALHDRLATERIAAAGIAPEAAAQLVATAAPLTISVPPSLPGDHIDGLSALLIALDYVLIVTLGLSGTWTVQSMVEERANRLLEALLACLDPRELMRGKLLGIGLVALTIVLVWLGCALAGSWLFSSGAVAAVLRPAALLSLASPLVWLAIAFYFVAGYLTTSIMFLAIGATSDSMHDVQGYVMPLVLLITLPLMAMLLNMIQDLHSFLAVVMSWIPIYTPFAMLARLGAGVTPFELIGTSALLLGFIALEFVLLGRVFRQSLLRAGQPPRLFGLVRLMLLRDTP